MADQTERVGTVQDTRGQALSRRWREVAAGFHAPETVATPAILQELWTNGVLIAGNGNEVSPWIDLAYIDSLRIGRTHAGGTYAFEVDWSRDGAVVDITQVVAVANNETGELAVAARYARFRVKNTDGITAFTAHRTNVFGR